MGDAPDADTVERRLNDAAEEREQRDRERAEESARKAEERARKAEERAAAKAARAAGGGRRGDGGNPGYGGSKELEQIGVGILAGGALLWFLNKQNGRPGMSNLALENPAVPDLQESEPHQLPQDERSVDYTKAQEKPAILPGPAAPAFNYWSQPPPMRKIART